MQLPFVIIFAILLSTNIIMAQVTVLDQFYWLNRMIRRILNNIYERESETTEYVRDLKASRRVQDVINSSVPFPCKLVNGRSPRRPTSVHMLRPGDIDVIGAIGDSLTAGFGAMSTNLFNFLREYRGVSLSIGGEKSWREYLTLPNILKEFNPNLIGYSLASSSSTDKESQFNVAVSAAISTDIISMTKVLIERMKKDKRVNITADWKMITILIGANDLCSLSCFEQNLEDTLIKHKSDLVKCLRLLRENLPRTFVNVISSPKVNLLRDMENLSNVCQIIHRMACPCIKSERFKSLDSKLDEVIAKWHQLDMEISNYEEFNKDDFAVVTQPVFRDMKLPRTAIGRIDYSYFSEDCFHLTQKSHAAVSIAVWNDLISPVGAKRKSTFSERMNCPTEEEPYLFTKRNSYHRIQNKAP